MLRAILLALALLLGATEANAAARFWVGGTGTWDGVTTTHWSATSGGAGGSSVPGAADDVTFDANSCGAACTITVNTTVNVNSITEGACTNACTLDFSVNNNNATAKFFSWTGTGTRSLNCGTGTFSITGSLLDGTGWDLLTDTNMTLTCGSATLAVTGTSGAFQQQLNLGASRTYGTITIAARTDGSAITIHAATAVTIGTLSISSKLVVILNTSATHTITNSITWTGTASNPFYIATDGTLDTPTLALAGGSTIAWAALRGVTFTGSPTCNNCLDLGGNSGITINAPGGGGGGGHIIGG